MSVKREEDKIRTNIVGGVIKTIKTNENGYFIATFTVKDKRKLMPGVFNKNGTFGAIKGVLTPEQALLVHDGIEFDASGEYVNNNFDVRNIPAYRANQIPKKTFVFKTIEFGGKDLKTSYIKQFLISEAPSVGPKLAERIFENISGENLEKLLEKSENEVLEYFKKNKIKGFSERIVKGVFETWSGKQEQRRLIEKLGKFGLSILDIDKVYREFGDDSDRIINQNPYQLIEIRGFGFKKADEIALHIGFDRSSDFRLSAYVESIIDDLSQQDTIFGKQEVIMIAKQKLINEFQFVSDFGLTIDGLIIKGFNLLVSSKKLIQLNENIYILSKYKSIEEEVFRMVEERMKGCSKIGNAFRSNEEKIDSITERFKRTYSSKEYNMLTFEQKKGAVLPIFMPISFIVGYAGSGKTTTTKVTVKMIQEGGKSCILVAPTNKACKRIREVYGLRGSKDESIQVKTIHALLGLRKDSDKLKTDSEDFDQNGKLKYDYIIVDETSMVGIINIYRLLKSLREDTKIIFVGDPFQLASIDTGSFLNDIVESTRYESFIHTFNSVFRVNGSDIKGFGGVKPGVHNIIGNSELIRSGKKPINADMTLVKSYFSIGEKEEEEVRKMILSFFQKISEDGDKQYLSGQILCPNYKGNLGIQEINKFCSQELNGNEKQVQIGNKFFRKNDKVFYNARNDKLQLVKGDTGVIINIDEDHRTMLINLSNTDEEGYRISVKLDFNDVRENLELGYAMSIHKSQGSEFDRVMIIMTSQSFMTINQNLLYTGYTRGKKVVYLISDDAAMVTALKRRANAKNTYLYHLLSGTEQDDIGLQKEIGMHGISKEEEKFIKELMFDSKTFKIVEKIKGNIINKTDTEVEYERRVKQYYLVRDKYLQYTDELNTDKSEKGRALYKQGCQSYRKYLNATEELVKESTEKYQLIKFKPLLKNFIGFRYLLVNKDEISSKNLKLEDNFVLDFEVYEKIKGLRERLFVGIKKIEQGKEVSTSLSKRLQDDRIAVYFDLQKNEVLIHSLEYLKKGEESIVKETIGSSPP